MTRATIIAAVIAGLGSSGCADADPCPAPDGDLPVTIVNATESWTFNHFIVATCGENDGALKYFEDGGLAPGEEHTLELPGRHCLELRVFAAGCGLSDLVVAESTCDADAPVMEFTHAHMACAD